MKKSIPDYFRRDQRDGVSPPDLSKTCTYAEHIVKARGKRTQLTSVSLSRDKIREFGPALYRVKQMEIEQNNHSLVEHEDLLNQLAKAARESDKEERVRALQAQRYARRRHEGIVVWSFSTAGIE